MSLTYEFQSDVPSVRYGSLDDFPQGAHTLMSEGAAHEQEVETAPRGKCER